MRIRQVLKFIILVKVSIHADEDEEDEKGADQENNHASLNTLAGFLPRQHALLGELVDQVHGLVQVVGDKNTNHKHIDIDER